MNGVHTSKLTSAEIAALWAQYLNETASICIHSHMLEHIKDQDISKVFTFALSLSTKHVEEIKKYFEQDHFPIPIGFTSNDYMPNAPQLFSDVFCLHYLNIMSIHGAHGYSGALTTSSRKDVREYFTSCNASAVELCNQTKDLLLEKGIYFRPPTIIPPETVDFVKDEAFLAGWFGDKRPLSCIEMTDIYFNLKKSIVAKTTVMAFSQVAKSKSIRDFLLNAVHVKDGHIEMFHDLLNAESLPTPPSYEAEITKSTTSPFSDKLMMFQVGFLFSTAMVYYGTGWASSPRRDLTPKYTAAIAGDLKIGADWIDLMIQEGWLEQPPLAEDRHKLAMKRSD